MAAALLPFPAVYTRRPIWTTVICCDESERDEAVVCTNTSTAAAAVDFLSIHAEYAVSSSTTFPGNISPRMDLSKDEFISDIFSGYSQQGAKFVHSCTWHTDFIHKWRRAEHSDYLEAQAAVMALEWATSHSITGNRVVLLSDSTVTIGALAKGRSSSLGMLLRCRKFGALFIAHDIKVSLVHVRSEENPADAPSRFEGGYRGPPIAVTNIRSSANPFIPPQHCHSHIQGVMSIYGSRKRSLQELYSYKHSKRNASTRTLASRTAITYPGN